jgi:V/A-type H+-transporting ATPase subunit D
MMEINFGFALASSMMNRAALVCALMMPKQSVALEVSSKSVMGVDVPVLDAIYKTSNKGDALSYGYAFTSGDLDRSLLALSDLLPDLLRLAQQEKSAQMLASEIEKTRRRVNALEYIIIPNDQDTVRFITMKLDENERGNLTRLMKVKDMMVAKDLETRKKRVNKTHGTP